MSVVKVTKLNFESQVIRSDKPVIVEFWAEWSGPCLMQNPVLNQLSEEYKDIKICKINVDEEELALRFGVMSIPTLVYFKDGKSIVTLVGFRSKEQLVKHLNL